MRELKFRAKNRHTGEWLYGDYHREGKVHYITKPSLYLREYAPIEFIVDAKTTGQFTGLRDKNGKEIYEGDIVRYIDCNDTISVNVVRYADAGFTPVCEIAWMADIEGTECEVIGNIHDNPGLLNT